MKNRRMGMFNNMFGDNLDDDILDLLDEAGITSRTKKKSSKSGKYNIGDNVSYKDNFGTIIYGPYEDPISNKLVYEIEMENGQILTLLNSDKDLQIYIPPVEEVEDDDLL